MITIELQKRIATSIVLLILLIMMFKYTYILLISLIVLSALSWLELNILINKAIMKNKFIDKIFKFLMSMIGLTYIVFFSYIMFSAFSNIEDKMPEKDSADGFPFFNRSCYSTFRRAVYVSAAYRF
mgnify:CR=1 FL=1